MQEIEPDRIVRYVIVAITSAYILEKNFLFSDKTYPSDVSFLLKTIPRCVYFFTRQFFFYEHFLNLKVKGLETVQ